MKDLLIYLKNYRKESMVAPLFKLLEACFELIVPAVMAKIIDIGIQNGDTAYILRMGLLLILFGLVGLLCSATAQYFAAKAAYGFGTALRKDFFRHVNRLSFAELDKIGTSALITRITGDINQVQSGVNLVLRLFLRSPFIVLGALIAAFLIHPRIALIFLLAIPLISGVIYLIIRLNIPVYRHVQQHLDRIARITRENLAGVRVIRAFSRQETEKKRFADETALLRKAQLLAGKISALLNPATYVLVNLSIVAILWYGGKEVSSGTLTQGEVIALVNYMTQILLSLITLANLIVAFAKATASAARIRSVLAYTPSVQDPGGITPDAVPGAPRISFSNVSFRYGNAEEDALHQISFTAKPGETIGVIGGTGAGKSTLVHLICRFYDATAGSVQIDGVSVRAYPFSALRQKIGIVPQRAVLFRGTIRENMRWRKQDATDEEIWKALRIAQAEEFVRAKPEGLDTAVLQEGKNFSGGQRQRLTIARALVGEPEILILDDSASALDFATDAALRRAIRAETQKTTVFLISQRSASLQNAEQILVLDDGRLTGAGTHRELLQSCDVYREICLSQLSNEEVARGEA
ncbi:ABC transporter transmembrane domain-containing protein [Yeguia hominis]|uniref:ABC transporter ATP-binding protein n=1 Tax=Yeguia hominis TaxID=2763662 RepID=A0A926HMW3_9FIRM|nr:ABC transporter ATP-binding protein [Yeguia hominis]